MRFFGTYTYPVEIKGMKSAVEREYNLILNYEEASFLLHVMREYIYSDVEKYDRMRTNFCKILSEYKELER